MIQYIYFLKCPNCEDEPFDFFDEAKAAAISCLGCKPIITQVEVCRNDFGECTDSNDLGTVWSWEDEANVTDNEPAVNVFTKGDFAKYNPDIDPEFDDLDNSLEYEPTLNTDDTAFHSADSLDIVPDNFRKPIPDSMTVEDLVEAMEENEEIIECKECYNLVAKESCTKTNKGYVCNECADTSLKETHDPFDHHDPDYDEEEVIDYIADKTDIAADSKYDIALESSKTKSSNTESLVEDTAKNHCSAYIEGDSVFIDYTWHPDIMKEDYFHTLYSWSNLEYEVDKSDFLTELAETLSREDLTDFPGGYDAFFDADCEVQDEYLEKNFDKLTDKYIDVIAKRWVKFANEAFWDDFWENYHEYEEREKDWYAELDWDARHGK